MTTTEQEATMGGDADATSTRDRVLAAIRTAPTPPTVEEVAIGLDLHHNSVRLHAATLREAGLITQDNRRGSGRGRPQITYRTSAHGAWTGPRDYKLLASLLLSELEGGHADPAEAARRIGRSWGRRIVGDHRHGDYDDNNAATVDTSPPAATTRDVVVAVLDEHGFEPTATEYAAAVAGDSEPPTPVDEVELRNCPFRELVDPNDGMICALHAGMLDGIADFHRDGNRDGTRTTVELLPFTSPRACTVRMHGR